MYHSAFSEPLAAVPPIAIATAVLRHYQGPLSAAIGPLPDAAIRAAASIADRCLPSLSQPLSAAAITDCCSPPLLQTAVRRRYRRPLSAAATADCCLQPLPRAAS